MPHGIGNHGMVRGNRKIVITLTRAEAGIVSYVINRWLGERPPDRDGLSFLDVFDRTLRTHLNETADRGED